MNNKNDEVEVLSNAPNTIRKISNLPKYCPECGHIEHHITCWNFDCSCSHFYRKRDNARFVK